MMFNIIRKDKCSRLVFDVGVGELMYYLWFKFFLNKMINK